MNSLLGLLRRVLTYVDPAFGEELKTLFDLNLGGLFIVLLYVAILLGLLHFASRDRADVADPSARPTGLDAHDVDSPSADSGVFEASPTVIVARHRQRRTSRLGLVPRRLVFDEEDSEVEQ
jgi:hypothetical protein